MKKIVVLMLFVTLCGYARDVDANPFRVAADYNLFVFGDIVQTGTDVEGRVAAGGDITYGASGAGNGFAVASTIPAPNGPAELVAGHNVTLTNGSVGSFAAGSNYQNGTIVYGGTADIVDVGHGLVLQGGNVIDFAAEQNNLTSLSANWASLRATGSVTIVPGEIDLRGTDPLLNVFSLQASDLATNMGLRFYAPIQSTILVNIAGSRAKLMDIGFYFNDVAGEPDTLQYPYSNTVFNFLDATDISINRIAVNGSILAPFAHVDLGQSSHVDGTLVASSLTGNGELHDPGFDDPAAVPEPASLALLGGGLAVLAVWRSLRARLRGGEVLRQV